MVLSGAVRQGGGDLQIVETRIVLGMVHLKKTSLGSASIQETKMSVRLPFLSIIQQTFPVLITNAETMTSTGNFKVDR
jgi:hypothetical protein